VLIFVSAGLLKPKKKINISTALKHNYLNYGLLGIATIAQIETGLQSLIIHGGFNDPKSIVKKIGKYIDYRFPIFLSLPSFQSVEWAAEFCQTLQLLYPSQRVVVGGRWVCDGNEKWIKRRLHKIDLIIFGTAEQRISKLVFPEKWLNVHGTSAGLPDYREPPFKDLILYDYKIIEDYISFHPSIEVSRGCGMGCSFCVEANAPLVRLRSPRQVINAIRNINSIYGIDDLNIYFEASLFFPSLQWASEFAEEYHNLGIKTKWRAETRVDSMDYNILKCLANAGLTILDIGLESASPVQILRMNKSKKPKIYIEKASRLLQNCRELGIATKINYLMYPGETENSYLETWNWLTSHRSCITGMSCGPLIVYGPNEATHRYLLSLADYGATPVNLNSLSYYGYTALNISKEIDAKAANEMCLALSRELMNDKDYFFLKAFSYFCRSFDYKAFRSIISLNSSEDFSFSIMPE
jgi:hypothetical protein